MAAQSNNNYSVSVNDYLNEDTPRDAQIMAMLLREMGVKEWEPRVVPQLLEFMHR